MRWFVEVTPLSSGDSVQRLTVEAATWQGALAQARGASGDTAPLSNFTIEVLSDGYRATNALARTRYVVSKAPADAPLTGPTNVSAAPAAAPATATPASMPPTASPSVPPPGSKSPAALAASALGRKVSQPRTMMNLGDAAASAAPAAAPAPAAPAAAPPAAATAFGVPRPASTPPPADAPAHSPSLTGDRGKVLLRKSEEPGARSPLAYRELAVAVPPGTPLDRAVSVARANLDDLRRDLASSPPGRLVQLAVFDHEWTGRPQRPPLVALTWKDWKGEEPDVKYPAPITSMGGPSGGSSGSIGGGGGAPPANPAAAPAATPAASAPVASSGAPSSSRVPLDLRGVSSEISSAAAAARPAQPSTAAQQLPAAIEAIVAAPFAARPQPASVATAPAPAPAPAPAAAAAPRAPTPGFGVPRPATSSQGPVDSARVSKRPDDLMSDVFESMHDVHFMRDSLDGADFVLELLREKIPTKLAIVHFFDINTQEFVAVKARAPHADGMLGTRTKEGIALDAVKTGKPVFLADARGDARWDRVRYKNAGHEAPRQVVVVPVRHGGRYLGALEVSDHVDGQAFSETELHALSYVGEQFAEFLNERGVQLQAADTGGFQVVEQRSAR